MFEIEFLGTGNAAQVPVWGCVCIACARAKQDNTYRRRSASLAIHTTTGITLVDAGLTDLAERFEFDSIERIVLTHFHMDHVQGLFHLRWSEREERIPVYRPDDALGADDLYKHPGVLDFQPPLSTFKMIDVGEFSITPLPLIHSRITLGYLFEVYSPAISAVCKIAYLTDTVGLPEATQNYLADAFIDILIIDCSEPPRDQPPKNHNDVNCVLNIHNQIQPKRTVLTHISHRLDQWLMEQAAQKVKAVLPNEVTVARDGQRLSCL